MIEGKILSILSKDGIAELFGVPSFSADEMAFYFTLETDEHKVMLSLGSKLSQIFFILQLGYFKAKSMFFACTLSIDNEDINYILKRHFPDDVKSLKTLSKSTCFENNSRILQLFSWQLFDRNIKKQTVKMLCELVQICVDPKYLFNCVLEFLEENHTVIPGYSTLQDMIGQALTAETQRLEKIIAQNLPASAEVALSAILEENDEQMYGVTLLKRDANGFNTTEMVKEVKKQEASFELFKASQLVIPKLEISEQNISYYAYLVDYYTADRLNELPDKTVQLYLLRYVSHRFEKINDNLVHGFIYHINNYKNAAKVYSKDAVYEFKIEGNSYRPKIGKILDLFTDEEVPDIDVRPEDFKIVEKEKFSLLKMHVNQDFDEEEFAWDYYKMIAYTISRNLRPCVKILDFDCQNSSLPLIKALTFLKEMWNSKKSLKQIDEARFPKKCIPEGLLPYLYDTVSVKVDDQVLIKKVFNVHAYELIVYIQLANSIDSSSVFINNSYSFKSLAEDLLPDWQTNKVAILEKLNNPMLNTPIKEQLQSFKDEFDPLILSVNQRIASGENKQVKVKQSKVLKASNSTDQDSSDSDSVKQNTNTIPLRCQNLEFLLPQKR